MNKTDATKLKITKKTVLSLKELQAAPVLYTFVKYKKFPIKV